MQFARKAEEVYTVVLPELSGTNQIGGHFEKNNRTF